MKKPKLSQKAKKELEKTRFFYGQKYEYHLITYGNERQITIWDKKENEYGIKRFRGIFDYD